MKFLGAERISMPKEVRMQASESGPVFHSLEDHPKPSLRERVTVDGQEHAIDLGRRWLGAMEGQIHPQDSLAPMTERNRPFAALSEHRHEALFEVKVIQPQTEQLTRSN